MADRSAGGWVSRALGATASVRPAASATDTVSAGRGWKAAITRACASRTASSLLGIEDSRLAARLVNELHAGDDHAAIDRLAHIVDGERGDRGGGERLHLHAGAALQLARGLNVDGAALGVDRELKVDRRQRQWMAERDQVGRLLGRHDAGQLGDSQHVAFLGCPGLDQLDRRGLHGDRGARHRDALGDLLGADIDHVGVAALVEVGEGLLLHAAFLARISRTATSTSGLRMKLSPIRNADAPTLAMRARSAGEPRPLSATSTRFLGTLGASSSVVARSTASVLRLRLLTPIRSPSIASARSSSSALCTSTSTSMPQRCASVASSPASLSSRQAMISSTQSAPSARASVIWYGSIMKSLRRAGSLVAARACTRN